MVLFTFLLFFSASSALAAGTEYAHCDQVGEEQKKAREGAISDDQRLNLQEKLYFDLRKLNDEGEKQNDLPRSFLHNCLKKKSAIFQESARNASSSLAAQADTFASAFVEALTLLERDPEPVLLAMGDVPLAPTALVAIASVP